MPRHWPLLDSPGGRGFLLRFLVALLFAAPNIVAASPAAIPDGAFVRVRGSEFFVGDRPFRFVGANLDPLHGDVNRARYREILDALAEDGLTVGRVWALGEDEATALPWVKQHALFRA